MDSVPSNREFAAKIGVNFPLLSDFKRTVSTQYGILDEARGTALRTTYVVDKQGIVQHIQQGQEAIDPSGAVQACSLLKK